MITVEQLWAVYLASLVVLGLIAIVLGRNTRMHTGIGLFIAVLLASVITYLVAITNIDVNSLEQGSKNSLQTLYWVIIIIIIIAFILMFYLEWSARKQSVKAEAKVEGKAENSLNAKTRSMLAKIYEDEKIEESAVMREVENPTILECDEGGCHLNRTVLDRTSFSYLA